MSATNVQLTQPLLSQGAKSAAEQVGVQYGDLLISKKTDAFFRFPPKFYGPEELGNGECPCFTRLGARDCAHCILTVYCSCFYERYPACLHSPYSEDGLPVSVSTQAKPPAPKVMIALKPPQTPPMKRC